MIIGKSRKELDKMREAGELIATVREEVRKMVGVGVTTMQLNDFAEKAIRDAGAYPTFLGYHDFPYSICASLNEEVVHGFPNHKPLKDGDIISIDMGATLNGFVGDTAMTLPVGNVSDEILKLISVTEQTLDLAIEQCYPGNYVGDIGHAVQTLAESHGYGIVKNFTGHGIGRKMHEEPQIPNYGKPKTKEKIRAGYVFAIEPMITLGSPDTKILDDGWTVITLDGKVAAHHEHTIAITEEGPEILTLTKTQKELVKKGKVETAKAA